MGQSQCPEAQAKGCWTQFSTYLKTAGQKVALFAYLFFQCLVDLLCWNFRSFYHRCKNFSHIKKSTPFILSRPPALNNSSFKNSHYQDLFVAYQSVEKVSQLEAEKKLNRELSKGFCHAEVLVLVRLIKQAVSTLFDQLSLLKEHKEEITLMETLEIFRYTFEMNNKPELIGQINSLLPEGLSQQKGYTIASCKEPLKRDLSEFNGLIATRVYNDSNSHTILLSLDMNPKQWSFYSPGVSGGYYEYSSFDAFFESLLGYFSANRQFTYLDLSYYPLSYSD